jgi:hypothetical protein
MPLQHISQNMLKIMKRGKGAEKLIELMNYMRSKPNSFVRTTFIAGHPGESEDDFEELCSFVEEFGFDRGNVFSYSDEEGTSAETRDDNLTTRYKRIKEQVITYTKDVKLPHKDVKRALETIEHIDSMMKEVSEYKGFLPIIFNYLDPASMASLKAKDIQGKLEMLAANDLYVQAAKIRTLES